MINTRVHIRITTLISARKVKTALTMMAFTPRGAIGAMMIAFGYEAAEDFGGDFANIVGWDHQASPRYTCQYGEVRQGIDPWIPGPY
jgi:hypothetical protein